MKKIIWLLILTVCFVTFANAKEYSREELEARLQKFNKMKRTGLVMTGVGIGFMVAGFALMNSADWEKETNGANVNYTTSDSDGGVGMLLFIPGVPLTVAGIVLASIGSKKTNQYQDLLQKTSVHAKISKDQFKVGVSVAF